MIWQIILILVVLIPILAIVLDSQVGRALAARLERRGLREGDDLLADRVAYLEGEVERVSTELLRLEEESRFLHDLLAERHEGGGRLPPPASTSGTGRPAGGDDAPGTGGLPGGDDLPRKGGPSEPGRPESGGEGS